jgi:hypothetical protein
MFIAIPIGDDPEAIVGDDANLNNPVEVSLIKIETALDAKLVTYTLYPSGETTIFLGVVPVEMVDGVNAVKRPVVGFLLNIEMLFDPSFTT